MWLVIRHHRFAQTTRENGAGDKTISSDIAASLIISYSLDDLREKNEHSRRICISCYAHSRGHTLPLFEYDRIGWAQIYQDDEE